MERRAEQAVLRTYVENQAILELILLYRASKCKKKQGAGQRGLFMGPYFYLFIRLLSAFFLFMSRCKQNKIKLSIIGCNLSKKHKITLYKTQNRESNYVDRTSFSLIFTRSYLPAQKFGDRHPNTIELAGCLVHALCDFKATWH